MERNPQRNIAIKCIIAVQAVSSVFINVAALFCQDLTGVKYIKFSSSFRSSEEWDGELCTS